MQKFLKKVMICLAAMIMMSGVILSVQPESKAEAKVNISKTKGTICTGETLQLALKGKAKKIKWKSDKKVVAAVDQNGLVTGKKKGTYKVVARSGGKQYTCKITVKKLPKSYATINGRKVKVGKKVKITHTVTSGKKVGTVSAHYYYYGDQIKILTPADKRCKVWLWNNGDADFAPFTNAEKKGFKDIKIKGKTPFVSFFDCWGVNPKNMNSTDPYLVPCQKGKVFDSFYVKVLKHGNFTFKSKFEAFASGQKVTQFTVTETIK